jgi:hypothetical protein
MNIQTKRLMEIAEGLKDLQQEIEEIAGSPPKMVSGFLVKMWAGEHLLSHRFIRGMDPTLAVAQLLFPGIILDPREARHGGALIPGFPHRDVIMLRGETMRITCEPAEWEEEEE